MTCAKKDFAGQEQLGRNVKYAPQHTESHRSETRLYSVFFMYLNKGILGFVLDTTMCPCHRNIAWSCSLPSGLTCVITPWQTYPDPDWSVWSPNGVIKSVCGFYWVLCVKGCPWPEMAFSETHNLKANFCKINWKKKKYLEMYCVVPHKQYCARTECINKLWCVYFIFHS